MPKKLKADVRLYIDDDYKSYLKLLAAEKDISLNKLLMELIEKKYPFNRKAKMLLKNSSVQISEVANTYTVDAGCDLSADVEQVSLDVPSLTSSTAVDDVVLESVETHSRDVEITVTPEEDTTAPEVANSDDGDFAYFDDLLSKGSEPHLFTKGEKDAMQKRITKIKKTINTAQKTGNHLPKPEYAKLAEQKKRLIAIVYPNNNKQ